METKKFDEQRRSVWYEKVRLILVCQIYQFRKISFNLSKRQNLNLIKIK